MAKYEYSDDFERLWSAFPSYEFGPKGSKREAWKRWEKARKNGELPSLSDLLQAVQRQIEWKRHQAKLPRWERAGGYEPPFQHVCRWISNARWEDDVPEVTPTAELVLQPEQKSWKDVGADAVW